MWITLLFTETQFHDISGYIENQELEVTDRVTKALSYEWWATGLALGCPFAHSKMR